MSCVWQLQNKRRYDDDDIDSNEAKIKTENFMRSYAVQERPMAEMDNLSNFQHIKNFTKMRHFMYMCIYVCIKNWSRIRLGSSEGTKINRGPFRTRTGRISGSIVTIYASYDVILGNDVPFVSSVDMVRHLVGQIPPTPQFFGPK